MSARLIGWLAAGLAILITVGLIVNEITDASQRAWWSSHSLTTDTVSGVLVLLVTLLVVNQLLNLRQDKQRSQAVAAQTAIVMAQAAQSTKSISSVISGSGDRGAASNAVRLYMLMLLISAPVFIDDRVGRHFLEQAQTLGAVMASTLDQTHKSTDHKSTDHAAGLVGGLDDAMKQLRTQSAPLLHQVSPGVRDSIQAIGGQT